MLSLGILALVLLAVVLVASTVSTNELVAWAWERHHNVFSWYISVYGAAALAVTMWCSDLTFRGRPRCKQRSQ